GILHRSVDLVVGARGKPDRRRGRGLTSDEQQRESSEGLHVAFSFFVDFGFLVRAQRSLADLDREFESLSSSVAVIASSLIAAYRPVRSPSRKAFFTMRSSPLWKLMIAAVPPGFRV